jgi:diguanylate cyclase (GGDEF)-like protein
LVARVGGDELAILLPGAEESEVMEVAERIRDRLATLTVSVNTTGNGSAVLTGIPASFGAAVYPEVAGTMDQLVLAADNALLTAKRAGRNTIISACPKPIVTDRADRTEQSDQPAVGDS